MLEKIKKLVDSRIINKHLQEISIMVDNLNNCRICLTSQNHKEAFVQIYSGLGEIARKIFLISGIEVVEFKEMPALICLNCVKELHLAFQFRKKCIEVNEYFRCEVPQKSWPELIERNEVFQTKNDDDDREVQSVKSEYLRTNNVQQKTLTKSINKKMKIKEKYFCSKCAKSFCDQNYLKKHEYYRHSHIPLEEMFKCDYCGHTTKTKQIIRNHINTVHSSRPKEKWICRLCGKMLSTKGNLESHEKTHAEIDPSQYETCPICQKKFREKRFMVEHRKLVHEKAKTYQCPHCPHVSTCKGAYNKHFKSLHLKLRDFICSDCNAGFSTNSQLTRHFRIHTGERPYQCSFCSKSFRLSSHRKRHEEICPKKLAD